MWAGKKVSLVGERRGVCITESSDGHRERVLDSAKYGFRIRYRSKRDIIQVVREDLPQAMIERFAKVDPRLWAQYYEEVGSALLEKAFLEGNTKVASQILGFQSMMLGSNTFERSSLGLEESGVTSDETDLGVRV